MVGGFGPAERLGLVSILEASQWEVESGQDYWSWGLARK